MVLQPPFLPVLGVFGLAGMVGLLLVARVQHRRGTLIRDTPTSTVRGLAIGLAEVKGAAIPSPGAWPLVAPYSDAPCLRWRFLLEEERTRTVTTMVNGRPQTRTEHYWATLASNDVAAPVSVRDGTGEVRLSRAADLPLTVVQSRFVSPAAAQALAGWRPRRLTEWRLPVNTPLYVLADAHRRPDAGPHDGGSDALVLQRPSQGPFIVSAASEEALAARGTTLAVLALVGALALGGLGTWLVVGGL